MVILSGGFAPFPVLLPYSTSPGGLGLRAVFRALHRLWGGTVTRRDWLLTLLPAGWLAGAHRSQKVTSSTSQFTREGWAGFPLPRLFS